VKKQRSTSESAALEKDYPGHKRHHTERKTMTVPHRKRSPRNANKNRKRRDAPSHKRAPIGRQIDDHQTPSQLSAESLGGDPNRAFCEEDDPQNAIPTRDAVAIPGNPAATGKSKTEPDILKLDPRIKNFIVKYLNPKMKLARSFHDPWASLIRDAQQLDWPVVQNLIRSLPYEDWFLRTLYWKIVADKVKERDNFTCQVCGRRRGLEAHHVTRTQDGSYVFLGSEHLHLDDLRTLCAVCHRVEHGQIVRAVIAEWELDDDSRMGYLQLEMEGFSILRRRRDEPPSGPDDAGQYQS
jgi:hypothetical protein